MSPETQALMQKMRDLAKDKPWNQDRPRRAKPTEPTPPPLTEQEQADIQEAEAERAAIQEIDGGLSRAEAEEQAKVAMRVFRYRLTTSVGWNTLVAPGWSLADAERDLRSRYGTRLVEVREHRPESRQRATV